MYHGSHCRTDCLPNSVCRASLLQNNVHGCMLGCLNAWSQIYTRLANIINANTAMRIYCGSCSLTAAYFGLLSLETGHVAEVWCVWVTALLQQVMNLTPQQIDLLPEQQKQQVLTLQKQMVRPLSLLDVALLILSRMISDQNCCLSSVVTQAEKPSPPNFIQSPPNHFSYRDGTHISWHQPAKTRQKGCWWIRAQTGITSAWSHRRPAAFLCDGAYDTSSALSLLSLIARNFIQ